MFYNLSGFLFFFIFAGFSVPHALGMWFVILLIHGILVEFLGEQVVHLPLFCGLAVTTIILVRGQWKGLSMTYIGFILMLLIVMLIASVAGLNLMHSGNIVMNYSKGMLLALLLGGCIKSEADIRVLTIYCIAGLFIGAFYSLYQYITGNYTISNIYEQRAAGLREDPNDTAMLLVSGVPLVFYWLFKTNGYFKKVLLSGVLLIVIFSIFLTGSRGGFVTLLLIVGALYLRRPSIAGLMMAVLLVSGLLAITPKTFIERMETLTTGKDQHGGKSLNNRMELQIKGVEMFLDNPVLGVGPGNFGLAFAQKKSNGAFGGIGSGSNLDDFHHNFGVAHNMHLEMFVETGIFGGLLFEALLLSTLMSLQNYDKYTRVRKSEYSLGYCFVLSLLGLYFAGLFLSQGKNSVMWFMIGIGFASHRLVIDDIKNKKGL